GSTRLGGLPVARGPGRPHHGWSSALARIARDADSLRRHATAGEHILLVDDEEGLRRLAKRALEMAGYRVSLASDGVQALQMFQTQSADIALIVSDLTMPRLDGSGLLRGIRDSGSRVPFLFTSGYPTDHLAPPGGGDSDVQALAKPWTVAELTSRVRAMVDGKQT
ncbi:MAG: response regulator transcription factor, partial [bacterium]